MIPQLNNILNCSVKTSWIGRFLPAVQWGLQRRAGVRHVRQAFPLTHMTSFRSIASRLGTTTHAMHTTSKTSLQQDNRIPQTHRPSLAYQTCIGLSGRPAILHYFNPLRQASFIFQYIANYRFYFIYMARTSFQAVRPLLAFSVFGEIMKMMLASLSSGVFAFLFSFVLAFEVLYFFLQCFISYTFLTMFFTCM